GEFQSFGQKPLEVAVLGDERRTMRVDDEDRALKTVKLFHGELDQGLERGESPFGRALPLLDALRYGQAANTESEPELFGIVIDAVECTVRVADGEQERHDRMSKGGRNGHKRCDARALGSQSRTERSGRRRR